MARIRSRVAATAAIGAMVAGATCLLAPSAGAATATADDDLVTQFTNEVLQAGPTTLVPATGQLIEPDVLHTVGQVVDAAGKLLRTQPSKMVASTDGRSLDDFPCVKDGGSKKLEIFPVANRILSEADGVVHFQYHPYLLRSARVVDKGSTNQFEVCTTGGGNLRGGRRLYRVGTGMALAEANEFRKIGQIWQTGSTPKDYSLNLGFQVAPKDSPISISGSITQTPTDKLMGSILGPFRTVVDDYTRNAVNAWWQDSCVDSWHGCHFRWNGSANFQGTVAQGLWEYPANSMPSTVRFYFQPYISKGCARSFGSC